MFKSIMASNISNRHVHSSSSFACPKNDDNTPSSDHEYRGPPTSNPFDSATEQESGFASGTAVIANHQHGNSSLYCDSSLDRRKGGIVTSNDTTLVPNNIIKNTNNNTNNNIHTMTRQGIAHNHYLNSDQSIGISHQNHLNSNLTYLLIVDYAGRCASLNSYLMIFWFCRCSI